MVLLSDEQLLAFNYFFFRRGSKASLVLDLRSSSTELGTSSPAPSILERYGSGKSLRSMASDHVETGHDMLYHVRFLAVSLYNGVRISIKKNHGPGSWSLVA